MSAMTRGGLQAVDVRDRVMSEFLGGRHLEDWAHLFERLA